MILAITLEHLAGHAAESRRWEEQVVAANVDTVFIVSGLDGGRNLNLRRIERYLTLVWNSGASPVIVLNKVDLCTEADVYLQNVKAIASGIPIHLVSAKEHIGLDAFRSYLAKGKTAAFLINKINQNDRIIYNNTC